MPRNSSSPPGEPFSGLMRGLRGLRAMGCLVIVIASAGLLPHVAATPAPPPSPPPNTRPEVVRVGILLPMFGTEADGYSDMQWAPRVGAYQAVRDINNKTDGVADHLLPNTRLLIAYGDSKCDSGAGLAATLHLTRDSFGGLGVSAMVGAGCSGASVTAAQVAATVSVPMISGSSTSPILSDSRKYPFFFRTIPSDAFGAVAIVDLLQKLWNYTSVALVHSTDSYGAGIAEAFVQSAHTAGLLIHTTQTFLKDASDFTLQLLALTRSQSRVIVLLCQRSDGSRFVRKGYEAGVGGEGFLFIGGDTLAERTFWEADPVFSQDEELRNRALKGLFALTPNGAPLSSSTYQGYYARRQQLPATGEVNGSCNLETDDDGNYLWAQDHDSNASTPLACAGYDDLSVDGAQDPFAYDAMFAIAYGMHELLYVRNRSTVVGSELLQALIRVRFDGVTGLVDFYDASADPDRLHHGDRRVGVSYTLYNFVNAEQNYVTAGSWTPCASAQCTWKEQWVQTPGFTLTYSTADNSKPPQTAPPRVTVLRIGVLLPMLLVSSSLIAPVYQALREINNKTDGVADELLPDTTLRFAFRDSDCDSFTGLTGALSLLTTAFSGQGVDAIIGAGCSGASISAAEVCTTTETPIISPMSTSAKLSDGLSYPFFLRTIPSDSYQVAAMVDILLNFFGYASTALIHGSDAYGIGTASAFREALHQQGATPVRQISLDDDSTDFSSQHREVAASGVRVLTIISQRTTATAFLLGGYKLGVVGEGYLWFASEALGDSWWTTDPVLSVDTELRLQILRGSFAMRLHTSDTFPAFRDFFDRRQQLPAPPVDAPECSLETDDDGNLIWAQDHDDDPATPLVCAGVDFPRPTQYDTYTYDAAYAIAYAVHDLLHVQNRTEVQGKALYETLVSRVLFQGASGPTDFFDASADPARVDHGDRRGGVVYALQNYASNEEGLFAVGLWTPCAGECEWTTRWEAVPGATVTFSTADNSQPPLSSFAGCPFGETVFNDTGTCTCDQGFELDSSGVRCSRCAAGRFKPSAGHAPCELCDVGTFQQLAGSSACAPCLAGEYQPEIGSVECRRCEDGRYSLPGASRCTMCAVGYFRESASSPVSQCASCAPLRGVSCGLNATVMTINVSKGYWRHSSLTMQTHACKWSNDWTPCKGQSDPGVDGDGYCEPGYTGPRCEVCAGEDYSMYFDKLDATCQSCGDVATQATAVFCTLAFLLLGGLAAAIFLHRRRDKPSLRKVLRRVSICRKIWVRAGMRYKVKTMIGLYQCMAAVPTVFNVSAPSGLEEFTRWMNIIELPADFGLQIVIPASCFGTYHRRLLIQSLWPVAVMLLAVVCCVCQEWVQYRLQLRRGHAQSGNIASFTSKGVQRALPLILVVTFLLVPSTATAIFKTYLCDRFDYAEGDSRRYLREDLSLSCESDQYKLTHTTSLFLVVLWPIGVPLFYTALLWSCRDAILNGKRTRLRQATDFLSGDYERTAFLWEPVEMLRKLTLTGAVLLIGEEHEQARILVALLVSVSFLALHLSVRPLLRVEDGVLSGSVELALILVYVCVLLIKTCSLSEEVCKTFGFGETASGIYVFFIFFGLGMILLQIVIGVFKLWLTGRVPKIFLVAKAHSVSPLTIIRRIITRRFNLLRRYVLRHLHLDGPRLSPAAAAGIFQFRTTKGHPPPVGTPESMVAAATGVMTEVFIEGIFPHTKCFLQVDLEAMLIRWSHEQFISVQAVEDHKIVTSHKRRQWSVYMPRISCRRPSMYASVTGGHKFLKLRGLSTSSRSPHRKSETRRSEHEFTDNILSKAAKLVPKEAPHISLHIRYNDSGGLSRTLELRMHEESCKRFNTSLRQVLNSTRRIATPAHWRWGLACMHATNTRGASGVLRRNEIRALLRRANASPNLTAQVVEEALTEELQRSGREYLTKSERVDLDVSRTGTSSLYGAAELVSLLVRLASVTKDIQDLFGEYSVEGRMRLPQWLDFQRSQQRSIAGTPSVVKRVASRRASRASLPTESSALPVTTEQARISFHRAVSPLGPEQDSYPFDGGVKALDLLSFALLLLDSENDAVMPARYDNVEGEDLREPLAHYWTACSHNSYIIGDQLTGLSSADAYRRQLMQGCRQVEIDCWDGKASPIVTHGHTFCTVENFEEVVKAIAETAFITSELPVVLSLEMHCSPPQQRKIAEILVKHLEHTLVTCEEVLSYDNPRERSPLDWKRRVLVKGKVKLSDKIWKLRSTDGGTSTRSRSSRARLTKLFNRSSYTSRRTATSHSAEASENDGDRVSCEQSRSQHLEHVQRLSFVATSAFVSEMERAHRKLNRSAQKVPDTDEFYSTCLCIRSVPKERFLSCERPKWPLTMTSINEDRLLMVLGLPESERSQLEGLQRSSPGSRAGSAKGSLSPMLSEEQLSTQAIVRLAADPPRQAGKLQRLTSHLLLRPFPLGLRFSGNNMSPLPCWLVGAQSVALNMSNNDLAVQLHFALFKGSGGYVLKPAEMRHPPSGQPTSPLACNPEATNLMSAWSNDSPQSFHERGNCDDYWPPPREKLSCTSISILSLHNLPKRGEVRPRYYGSRGGCHKYHKELSGVPALPDNSEQSCPAVKVSLHPIGGFCALSEKRPLAQNDLKTELTTPAVKYNGLNAPFGQTVHCVAAEPAATFLRVGILDGSQEVAYETAVLGRLRVGYRVFQMRSMLGTRIELCYLFVKISTGTEPNQWSTPRQLRIQSALVDMELSRLDETIAQQVQPHLEEVSKLKEELASLRRSQRHVLVTKNTTETTDEGDEDEELSPQSCHRQSGLKI